MWHPVKGEALVSVASIYNPPPPLSTPHSLCVSVDSLLLLKDFFHFQTPSFQKPFCVYLLCRPLSLPSLSLSLLQSVSLALPLLSLCSFNLWQTLLRALCGTETAAQNSEEKGKHIGKHHSPEVSVFSFDAFHLISLTSHLPLTKSIDSESQSPSLSVDFFFFCLYAFGWHLQKLSLTRREEDGRISAHLSRMSQPELAVLFWIIRHKSVK